MTAIDSLPLKTCSHSSSSLNSMEHPSRWFFPLRLGAFVFSAHDKKSLWKNQRRA